MVTGSMTEKLVSSPTAFKLRKHRWWIPRFVYQIIISDIEEVAVNQASCSSGTKREDGSE